MTVRSVLEVLLLSLVVLACWIGAIGMVRMREPVQAMHYLSLPAFAGVFLTIAVFVRTGSSQAAWKTVLIAMILLGINSVVTHATARAFRTRDIGHWEPLNGDPMEFVRDTEESDA